uniref:uncharacterized protein C18orf63 n=1 Tax=Scatophagus argus TaxID=75038 RepID=UPI001ED7E22C|nr:uncharacterized protein C18orf63 [Scatophagus argus]
MSAGVQHSMCFLGLPDLKKLCCITVTLQEEDEELRSRQMKTCRELVLLYSDILASPALDSFCEITVVMAIPFFHRGILQAFGQRRSLQLGSPQCVFPGVLQCCLSYSLITRLAPSWNKAGLYLVTGRDFLSESGRLGAVSLELSTCEGHLCISTEGSTVRLPPATLEDFDLPPLVLRRFCSEPDAVLDPSSTGGAVWCHVLPREISMKKGQIISISHKLPRDGPFKTYRDLQNHWNCLYGYRLPELPEEDVVYCSVFFRLLGQRLFTYPLSCIRLQPVQRCPRVDQQGALGSFLSDIRHRLQSVCGFPARLTVRPCYHTISVDSAAAGQVWSGEEVNLPTCSSSSIRPALTQLPPPPPPPPSPPRPLKFPFGSQPPALAPLCQQEGAQGLLGNRCGFRKSVIQSQESGGDWPSSVLSPLPPPGQTPAVLAPKLVPIFRNKSPSRHINVALLRVQKQKEQLSGGEEKRGRVTLPSFRTKTRAASVPGRPPPAIPHCNHHPKPRSGAAPQATSKPGIIPKPQKLESKFKSTSSPKTNMKRSSESQTAANSSSEVQEQASAASPLPSSEIPDKVSSVRSGGGIVLKSKPNKSRSAVRRVEVEEIARSNQLSRLKGRGALVSAKNRKEELILKVMGCVAEA